MWIREEIAAEVRAAARVFYIDRTMAARWNANRRDGEPRLMGGWAWETKDRSAYQVGLRSMTAAYIDAWCRITQTEAPGKTRLRVVARRAA